MFLGTHTPRLDDKGRLILPAKFRDELAGGVVITKGQERCLYVFPMPEFQRIAGQLREQPVTHKANSQQKYGKGIAKSKKKVGDLIIIRSGSYGYHAGIYAGGNKFYDSPRSGKRVSKRKIFSSNYVVRRLV